MESSPKAREVLTAFLVRLVIRFNSRIVHALSRVTLLGPNSRRVILRADAKDPSPKTDRLVLRMPPVNPGTYLVQGQVLSVDGHITAGSFSFTIQPQGSDGISEGIP